MQRGLPGESDLVRDPHSLYEGVEYKRFWTGMERLNLDKLEHAIVRDLLPISGRRIVDVGCGYGRLADCYMDRFQQVIMVDGSMSLLRQAFEKTRGQAIYIACDVRHLPLRTASVETVLMIRVFHHIQDSQTCLAELHRILYNEGWLIFSFLNKQNALRVIRWLIGANPDNPFTTNPAGVGSTMISHHPKAVHEMLRMSGFPSMQDFGAGVLDRLVGKIHFTGKWITPAKYLAPFFAWSKIAPWILCRAIARGNTNLIDTMRIEDLLQCPSCGGSLSCEDQGYHCLRCYKCYPVVDGIIDLRLQ